MTRSPSDRPRLFPLAATTVKGLRAQAHRLRDHLRVAVPRDARSFDEVARRLSSTDQAGLGRRAVVVAGTPDELLDGLDEVVGWGPERIAGQCAGERPSVVFVFSGIGAHWPGMGRELLATEPVFRDAIEGCDRIFSRLADWSLLDELTASSERSRFDEIEIAACSTFALGVALAELLRSWGVVPDVVIGHSMGEITGAHVAGALSRADAARVIYHWSRVQAEVTTPGAMLAAALSPEQAARRLAGLEDRVSLAAINSPMAVTFSGDPDCLQRIEADLKREEIFCRFIPTGGAYHSYQMEEVRDLLISSLQGIEPAAPEIRFVSTVIDPAHETPRFDAEHWFLNLRRTVRLAPVVDQLIGEGHETFLEIGPHPVTATALRDGLSARGRRGLVLATLRRDEPQLRTLLDALAALYCAGQPLLWERLHGPAPEGRPASLEPAPWELEDGATEDGATAAFDRLDLPATNAALDRETLLALDPARRVAALEEYLLEQGARVLKTRPSELDPDRSWLELGLDSLRATELRARVQGDLCVTLSLVRFLAGITVRELAAEMLPALDETSPLLSAGSAPSATVVSAAASTVPAPGDIDDLSSDQVDALLHDLLGQMQSDEAGALLRELEV